MAELSQREKDMARHKQGNHASIGWAVGVLLVAAIGLFLLIRYT